ncbi:GNAT family N-acetyltransferase [Proteus vulgaris]|uniref:GNAT family N-acetyltransferase n=1 Tax=Proteus vulgaris TaxID=585 RepID=UPI001FFF2657|nr:GNAT family protein [Proteus vulgaris]UPK82733.1 GNAT family N-acetyltransferase [Proteus vulgaris]
MEFIFKKITEDDWPFFKELYDSEKAMQFISNTMTEEQIKEAFNSRLPEWNLSSLHWLCFVIYDKTNTTPLGLTGLRLIHQDGELIGEIGYILSPEQTGKSIGTKSLAQLLNLPELASLKNFQAIVTAGNIASERVLEKNGFILTQVLKDNYVIGDVTFDDHVYTLIK